MRSGYLSLMEQKCCAGGEIWVLCCAVLDEDARLAGPAYIVRGSISTLDSDESSSLKMKSTVSSNCTGCDGEN